MWTLFIFLNLWGLHCTVATILPSPINVSFSSVNLRNVLHWFPGNGSQDDTHFTVEYAIYGDSVESSKGRRVNWRAVRQCTEIVRTWCDLSQETEDVEQGYHARVRAVGWRASSKWALTRRRFDPKSDTTFGPPLVSVEIENNSAIITLKGPMRYPPNNHTPALSMAALYPYMTYNLSIHNTHRNQVHRFSVVTSPYRYHLMEYNTEYCFSAQSHFFSMPVKCQSSAWQCITTPQDPVIEQLQSVVVGIVVPALCICIIAVAGYVLYHYLTGKGQKSPYILNPPSFHPPPLMFHPENLNHILISDIKNEPPSDTSSATSDPKRPKHQLRTADPPPIYSPLRPETPWNDSSIDYGFVSEAPDINVGGEEEARERRQDEGDDGNNQKSGPSDGLYSPQLKSYLPSSTHTCRQARMPIQTQTHDHTQAWSQINSALLTRTQKPLLSFQRPTTGEDGEFQGLFISRNPQTGLFRVPLNLQTNEEGGKGEELGGSIRVGTIAGGVEEGRQPENVPLLSAYTSQNIKYRPTSRSDQSDFLSDDYGILRVAPTQETEEDDYDDDGDEDKGTICINWDPETRKLVLPEMGMGFNKEGGLNGSVLSERGRVDGIGGEDEEGYVTKGELRLENVYVRQGSEEEAEAKRQLEKAREAGWEADDILTKWDLVISMDQ